MDTGDPDKAIEDDLEVNEEEIGINLDYELADVERTFYFIAAL